MITSPAPSEVFLKSCFGNSFTGWINWNSWLFPCSLDHSWPFPRAALTGAPQGWCPPLPALGGTGCQRRAWQLLDITLSDLILPHFGVEDWASSLAGWVPWDCRHQAAEGLGRGAGRAAPIRAGLLGRCWAAWTPQSSTFAFRAHSQLCHSLQPLGKFIYITLISRTVQPDQII